MKLEHTGISNIAATVLVIVVLIVGAGATYFYVSSTTQGTTATITGATVTTQTTKTVTTQTSSTGPNVNIDPHPDQFVYETIGQPQYLDPSIDYETAGAEVIQNVYEQLMFFKGADATNVVPWLASSQTISSDGLTYTYQLRQGIKFTDGTPFNATAVYYSIMRAMILDDPDGPTWAISQILNGGQNYSVSYNGDGKYTQAEVDALVAAKPVTIDGPYTVSFHLTNPYAAFPYIMAFSVTAVLDPTAYIAHWTKPTQNATGYPGYITGATAGDYADAANPWPITNMVGTGPYALTSWDQSTQTLVLKANSNYWGGPDGSVKPTITNVIIKGVDDPNTRELDLKAGSADMAGIPVATGQIFNFVDQTQWFSSRTIKDTYPGVTTTGPFATFETDFLGLNQAIRGPSGSLQAFQPFTDPRIRQAMSYLWDDNSYVNQVMKGFAPQATQIIPPGMFGYNASIPGIAQNTTKAQQLLIAAGTNPLTPDNAFSPSNPKSIQIGYNTGSTGREVAATIMAAAINSISSATGLSASVQPLPWPQYLAALTSKQLQLFYLGWIVDYVDPDDFLVPFATNTGLYMHRVGYVNDTITGWVKQQATETDPTARAALIQKVQVGINQAHIYIWEINGVNIFTHRTWVIEKPNAFISSNMATTSLTALYGPYYASIQAVTG